jgi:hypothetical protein
MTPPDPGWDGSGGATKASTEIVLKYCWKSMEVKPTAVETALEKVKTVASVELPADTRTCHIPQSDPTSLISWMSMSFEPATPFWARVASSQRSSCSGPPICHAL